ncbi:MAG TPA: peptidase [Gammaproteobacteria bacterium]|nr:peptidase [Gammaproteobacteria bacterium]
MTYCIGIALDKGLVFCSDSRTNAGIDQVSTYSKMHAFGIDGDRQFVLLSAGNLATTQSVVHQLRHDIRATAERSLMTVTNLADAADYIGEISIRRQARYLESGHSSFDPKVSFVFGGQIKGEAPGIFLIYPEGNYITASRDHPFLQIGESKYGKPILDRVITPATSIDEAAKCAIVSMDSTVRSNLSVGPPIELRVYETDGFVPGRYLKFEEDDAYLRQLARSWNQKVIEAFAALPEVNWSAAETRDS